MKLTILLLLLTLPVACKDKKDKKNDAPATTTPPPAETVTPPPTTTTTTPAPTPLASGYWKITKENCAAIGRAFDAEKPACVRVSTKEACDLLANGSKFEFSFGVGECIGPRHQPNAAYCAGFGQKFDQGSNSCQAITVQAECEALANGSIFDTGFQQCMGVKYLPSADNCAAYGSKFDATTGKCTAIRTEAECTALNSDAIFDAGFESCIGRCEYRNSILDECYLD
ncbi:hypothetical protein [Oligoflexus tunisiensis]|uniref:hypothetical protein n=1 Tax=Oligoflexus tunisiensis TaxID=708132 RepID=UPI00114CE8E8|nr:hypothetical protein [Oligoflexus tunisiensis]